MAEDLCVGEGWVDWGVKTAMVTFSTSFNAEKTAAVRGSNQ